MNSLYTLAQRQTNSISNDLSELEAHLNSCGQSGANPSTSGLHGQIAASLAGLQRTMDDYEGMARREMVEEKKAKAVNRVQRFKNDYASLRHRYDRLKQQESQVKESSSRAALFGNSSSLRTPTFESPFSLHSRGGGSTSASTYPPNGGGGMMFDRRTDHALDEHSFLANASTTVDGYIQQGQAVLGNLVEQKELLKGTRKRLLDAANTLGLSRNTISFIERRTKEDWIIICVGAIGTFVSFFLILKYFG